MAKESNISIKNTKTNKMKSIKDRILISVLILVLLSLIILGGVSVYLNYTSTTETLEQTMIKTAEIAAERVEWEINAYLNVASELGATARLSSSLITKEEKQRIIDQKIETYEFVRGKLISSDGIAEIDGTDYSDRDYFKQSMQGITYVTEPIPSKTTGELSVIISAPVWEGGIPGSKITGVIFIVPDINFLNDIVASIKVSENGTAYLIDANGNTIAHQDQELVASQSNTAKEAETNSSLKPLALMEKKMVAGETGFGTYKFGGIRKFLAYAPVAGTNGWSIGVNAPISDFMEATLMGIIITVALVAISLLAAFFIVRKIAISIGNPIKLCANRLDLLADGDLQTKVPEITTNDETGILAKATENIVQGMKNMIGDINYILGNMADGNFNVHSRANESYVGDFKEIIQAVRKINYQLSDTLRQIRESSEQVSSGSGMMADGAQNLAEGASEQAAAVEELLASVTDVSEKMTESAQNAEDTSKEAKEIGNKAAESASQMKKMTQAMEKIRDASSQISNIIKTIEDIAGQTNLLSLNAAIEAARAGEAGKGFAVVAEEIRQLANQSASAVDDTRTLIAASIEEVQAGNVIAEQTEEMMDGVIGGIQKIVDAITIFADSSLQQSESMHEINKGIDQISQVVQANSATAEESSATSEELSAQADTLNQLVGQFTLREKKK